MSHPQAKSFFEALAEQVPDWPRDMLVQEFINAVRHKVPRGERRGAVIPIRSSNFPKERPQRPSQLPGTPWQSEQREEKAA